MSACACGGGGEGQFLSISLCVHVWVNCQGCVYIDYIIPSAVSVFASRKIGGIRLFSKYDTRRSVRQGVHVV